MKKEILALIPARSGSKGIAHKNIRSVGGKPLIAWTIEQALESKLISRVVVSTDSEEYASIARNYGAEVPFLRPEEIARDNSTDLEVFKHTLDWFFKNENYSPEYCVHLRPTNPIRKKGEIDNVIRNFIANENADSIRTVAEATHTPYKMWNIDQEKMLQPLLNLDGVHDPYNQPRQILPTVYIQTANIDVVKSSVILDKNSMTGENIMGYIEDKFYDIDSLEELEKVILTLVTSSAQNVKNQTICFDIDGVIATLTPDNDYSKAKPNGDVIQLISELKKIGFRIVLYTARGSATGIDWRETTELQMKTWGVEYEELHLGKPAALYYVDDRLVSVNNLMNLVNNIKY